MRFRFGYLLFLGLPTWANEPYKNVDLWLPTAYQEHYDLLYKSAKLADQDPYCDRLLSGRLLESRSTPDKLYFHFRCRASDQSTFSLQIDPQTMVVTNSYGDIKRKLEEEKKAKQAQIEAEKQAELDREKERERLRLIQIQSQYWGICRKSMKERLKYFQKVSILTKLPPEPLIKEDEFTYSVDFDAVSQTQRAIYFTIQCQISNSNDHQIDVFSRGKLKNK